MFYKKNKTDVGLSQFWWNWNLEILVFVEEAKPENPEKLTLDDTRQKPTTKSTHIRHQSGIKPRSH